MKRFVLILASIILVLPLVACGQLTMASELKSAKQRIVSPQVGLEEQGMLAQGNSAFAFDLYKALKNEEGNLFCSPYSISAALAMTYAGARGETAQQMADTLHFLLSEERLHPNFNALDIELGKRGQGARGKDDEGFRLKIVNAIWGQKDFEFLPDFLDVLAENYGAGLRILDFINNAEKSRTTINDWVSKQTEGRIEDLIPQGVIDKFTRMVLTNAIYFNAAWQNQFDEELTADDVFHRLDGGQVVVPMMRQSAYFGYGEGGGYQAVELPYDGEELSMVILLPEAGNFAGFESSLDAEVAAGIIGSLVYNQVSLTMPKFEFDSDFSLKDTLSAMGMPVAFSGAADFSGMTGESNLVIDDVLHKAFVSVDEAGTEAAAATAVIVKETSAPVQQITVKIDRPFIFLIRDIEANSVLFIGRVLNPAA
ncbi:MAG: serpin family protein [Dehalococcoidales bacterium]|nr:serpin family protein [Dehalococcoidales bacterium]